MLSFNKYSLFVLIGIIAVATAQTDWWHEHADGTRSWCYCYVIGGMEPVAGQRVDDDSFFAKIWIFAFIGCMFKKCMCIATYYWQATMVMFTMCGLVAVYNWLATCCGCGKSKRN